MYVLKYVRILYFALDIPWTVEEYETKVDILREIHFRRTKSYACGNGMDADVKRKFKEKLQNFVCDYYINYHPGLLIHFKTIKEAIYKCCPYRSIVEVD